MGTIQDIGTKTSPEHKAEAKKGPGYKKATPDLFEVGLVDFFVPRGLPLAGLDGDTLKDHVIHIAAAVLAALDQSMTSSLSKI